MNYALEMERDSPALRSGISAEKRLVERCALTVKIVTSGGNQGGKERERKARSSPRKSKTGDYLIEQHQIGRNRAGLFLYAPGGARARKNENSTARGASRSLFARLRE